MKKIIYTTTRYRRTFFLTFDIGTVKRRFIAPYIGSIFRSINTHVVKKAILKLIVICFSRPVG